MESDRFSFEQEALECERVKLSKKSGVEQFVLRLKGKEGYMFQVLSRDFYGFKIHWHGDHSEPHYKSEKNCPGCRKQLPAKLRFYLDAFCVEKKQRVFLEFTEKAAQDLEAQLIDGQCKRGLVIHVKRSKSDNGRLTCKVLPGGINPKTMPEERDPHETLMRLWRVRPDAPEGGKEFPTHSNGFAHAE